MNFAKSIVQSWNALIFDFARHINNSFFYCSKLKNAIIERSVIPSKGGLHSTISQNLNVSNYQTVKIFSKCLKRCLQICGLSIIKVRNCDQCLIFSIQTIRVGIFPFTSSMSKAWKFEASTYNIPELSKL